MGDKLHALTGGRLEHMAESEERNGHSREMDQAQEIPRTNGVADGHRGGNASRLGGDGHVNANGEWEAKWSEGTQRKQVEFAKNVDVKVEMVVSCGDNVCDKGCIADLMCSLSSPRMFCLSTYVFWSSFELLMSNELLCR